VADRRAAGWHSHCEAGDRNMSLNATSQPLLSPRPAQLRPHCAFPRLVAIGGGTGLPAVLEGLAEALWPEAPPDPRDQRVTWRAAPGLRDQLTAIVTVTDDGGSSGVLRRAFGMLPPGDVRNCLAALADRSSPLGDLLQHRFAAGHGLHGHPVGNLLLAALTEQTGDFAQAVERLSDMLALRGRVFPSTAENVTLVAEFAGGASVEGETAIASRGAPIRRLSLRRPVRPLPETLRALVNADAVVVGPGSLYTSILPNLLVGGIARTLSGVNGVRIYVANLMTEPGETDGFSLDDHLRVIREHAGCDLFDYVVVNDRQPDEALAGWYGTRGAVPVRCDLPLAWAGRARVVRCPLAAHVEAGRIRHDPAGLAEVILDLTRRGRPAEP
jgi:uncharacterized cofD-like protein